MNRITLLLSIAMLAITAIACAETPAVSELRPTQKIMQARAGWVKAMNENLAAKKFADVAKDAGALSAQTGKVAENLQGERKDLTLKVSQLAKATADAAVKEDAESVKAKLGEIKATCGECHAKYRDKK